MFVYDNIWYVHQDLLARRQSLNASYGPAVTYSKKKRLR